MNILLEEKKVKVKFLNGSCYEGAINSELEFTGFGKYSNEKREEVQGIFNSSDLVFEFDVSDPVTKEFLQDYPVSFFKDSQKFMRENPELLSLPMLRIKTKNFSFTQGDTIG